MYFFLQTGTTPLMKAAKYDRTDIVKKLISLGAIMDLSNKVSIVLHMQHFVLIFSDCDMTAL